MTAVTRVVASRSARALALAALVLVLGCGQQTVPYEQRVDRDPNVILVYTACGLAPAVESARARFEAENPGKSARVRAGEPVDLVRRIREGDVPDLFVCPGEAEVGLLEREGYLDRGSRRALRTLRLVVAVPAGNPAAIQRPEDLLSDRVDTILMSTPGMTSPGTHGKHALDRAGIYPQIQDKLILQETPLAALEMLADGEADAGIIYDPCLRLAVEDDIPPDAVEVGAPLVEDEDRLTKVYLVEHKRAPNSLLAQRFIRILTEQSVEPPAPQPSPADAALPAE